MPNPFKKFRHFVKDHKKTVRTIAALIVIGVGVSLITVWLEERWHHTPGSAVQLVWWKTLALTLLDHAGVGVFAAAILGVVIELPHMYEYFQERIQNTIINRNFIKQLSDSEQENLQEQALEAYFGVEELNQEGGFYKFYTQKIRSHIGGSFRKGTTFETHITLLPGSNLYEVTDSISYTCKRGNKGLPEEAVWITEQDEIDDVLKLEITATRPGADAHSDAYPFDKATGYSHPALVKYETGHGYRLPLREYAECDELAIKIAATYTVSHERPFSWSMPVLSDSITGDIYYPENLDIFVDLFGLDESMLPKKADLMPENGVYKYRIEHKTWLLPDDGFSFHFRQVKPST